MNFSTRILSWVFLVLVALTSAILCIAPPSLGGKLGALYVGTVYGVLLGVYFVTCRGVRSAGKLFTLVVVSAIAWPIAYFGSFAAMEFIPGATVQHGDAVEATFPLIALGGVLGGVALLIPMLLLLKPSSVTRDAALGKAFLGILLSGIVGGVAWELGPTLGAAIWRLLPTEPLPRPESYDMAALFLVWQLVITSYIGWATSEKRMFIGAQTSGSKPEVSAQSSQFSSVLDHRVFVVLVAILAALSLTRIIPVRLRLAHRERAATTMKKGRPSATDIAVAQPITEEEALILNQIGDYQPGHVVKTVEMASHEKGFEKPVSIYFSTLYMKTGEPVPQWPQAPRQYISIVVQQYPNSEWAQYFAEYPANRYNSFDNPKQHAIVVQFDNRVRSNQLERYPGQAWYPLYYMWPHGDCVITVEYHTPDEDLEIVRAYVEKYPSSIP